MLSAVADAESSNRAFSVGSILKQIRQDPVAYVSRSVPKKAAPILADYGSDDDDDAPPAAPPTPAQTVEPVLMQCVPDVPALPLFPDEMVEEELVEEGHSHIVSAVDSPVAMECEPMMDRPSAPAPQSADDSAFLNAGPASLLTAASSSEASENEEEDGEEEEEEDEDENEDEDEKELEGKQMEVNRAPSSPPVRVTTPATAESFPPSKSLPPKALPPELMHLLALRRQRDNALAEYRGVSKDFAIYEGIRRHRTSGTVSDEDALRAKKRNLEARREALTIRAAAARAFGDRVRQAPVVSGLMSGAFAPSAPLEDRVQVCALLQRDHDATAFMAKHAELMQGRARVAACRGEMEDLREDEGCARRALSAIGGEVFGVAGGWRFGEGVMVKAAMDPAMQGRTKARGKGQENRKQLYQYVFVLFILPDQQLTIAVLRFTRDARKGQRHYSAWADMASNIFLTTDIELRGTDLEEFVTAPDDPLLTGNAETVLTWALTTPPPPSEKAQKGARG
ncbi:hypothetical protein HK101_002417 [Irineochytrium annulatum]|nr:hypothetical protein HK101_002417 [Irineochytrium annulatum]